ncbi:Uncharacterised protein [Prevotella melaninogenica]|nr:Uncharacterised protein [Prevotella melaninogenica]
MYLFLLLEPYFVKILCFILSSCNVLHVFGRLYSLTELLYETGCFYNIKKS